MKILLDRSVEGCARIFEFTSKNLGINSPIRGQLAGIVAKRLGGRDAFVSEQRGAILSLARLAASGGAEFLHSRISFDEGFRVARWPDLASHLDLLKYFYNAHHGWATLPFDFAKIPDFYGDNINDIARYHRTLCMTAAPSFFEAALRHPNHFGFSDIELKNLQTFQSLAKFAGPNREHIFDLFQLWTADINGISYYATCDNKFIRFMTRTMKSPFLSKPILPSELCNIHAVPYWPLQPARNEDFYTIAESPLARMIEAHDRHEPPPRSHQTIYD